MTMPRTAEVAKSLGRSPQEWSDAEIDKALKALSEDLPGDPIGYALGALSASERCECGALHLAVNAPDLDPATRGSLHRLLATPFGNIVRERVRRHTDVTTIRFGWEGIDLTAPKFVRVVDVYDVRGAYACKLDDQTLGNIVAAIRQDLPGMMAMFDQSLGELSVRAVKPQPGDEGRREWKALIDQVMFGFSTPLRKYLDEYAARYYEGARVGAVNCCIVMAARLSDAAWQDRWFGEQVCQQLTPDC